MSTAAPASLRMQRFGCIATRTYAGSAAVLLPSPSSRASCNAQRWHSFTLPAAVKKRVWGGTDSAFPQ